MYLYRVSVSHGIYYPHDLSMCPVSACVVSAEAGATHHLSELSVPVLGSTSSNRHERSKVKYLIFSFSFYLYDCFYLYDYLYKML